MALEHIVEEQMSGLLLQMPILYWRQQLKRGGKGGGGPSDPSKEASRPTPRSSEKQRAEPAGGSPAVAVPPGLV